MSGTSSRPDDPDGLDDPDDPGDPGDRGDPGGPGDPGASKARADKAVAIDAVQVAARPRVHSLSGLPRLVAGEPLETEIIARKLLVVAAVRVGLVTLALIVLFVLAQLRLREIERVPTWQYVLVGLAYALSLTYVALLRSPLLVVPLAYAQIALDTLIISVLVIMTGGFESVFTFGYVFTVLGAASTLYRRGAIVAVVTTGFALGTILSLHLTGDVTILPRIPFGSSVFSYVLYCVGMGLVGVLSSALAEKARITGRRLAESQSDLEQLEALHAAILRSLPAGLITIDVDGVVRFSNEAAQQILQKSRDELLGRNLFETAPVMGAHWRLRRESLMADPLRERLEETFIRGDGRAIRLGFSFAPLGTATERWLGSIVVFQDLTDIVRLKEAVERAERLATLGKLAAGLAHEVRNPLASMCASIDVLNQALDPPEAMKRLMANVVREGERLNSLISDFLTFARPRELQLEETNLARVVSEVLDLFRHEASLGSCEIVSEFEAVLVVSVDTALFKQVLWNLLRNASEAMRQRSGRIIVKTRAEDDHPTLSIKDDGPGIPQDQLRRIFDPFFTTKEGGSGLGLAISHSILAAHGAQITVESRVGEGTEFCIRFPRRGARGVVGSPKSGSAGTPIEVTKS